MRTTEEVTAPLAPQPGRHRRHRRRRPAAVGAAVLAAVGVIAFLVAVADDEGGDEQMASGSATTRVEPTATTEAPSPAAPATSATTVAVDRSTAIWPAAGAASAPADPVDAARRFATSYLGFTEPNVGAFRQGDTRSGEVDVRPTTDGPVTTILVRQLSGETTWSVLGATTSSIEVTGPAAGEEIGAPVTVAGRAFTFEGHVAVEVRQDGRTDPAGEGFVGGGDEMRPFAGEVSVAPGAGGYGAVVFLTRSADDGRVWQAAARRVRLRPGLLDPASCGAYRSPRHGLAADDMEVKVFFTCEREGSGGISPYPVYRAVPRSTGLLRSALEALLAGPNPTERAATIGSWFSATTKPLLRSVTVTAGHAVVDFGDLRPVIPGAGSSAGSRRLLSELDATVFQFPSVTSVEYRLLGSCEAFAEWLQFGTCERRTRQTSSSSE